MDINLTISQREMDLILTALYVFHIQCISEELNFELVNDLGGIPDEWEIWELREKFKIKENIIK